MATAVLEDTHALETAAVPLPVKVVLNPKHTEAVAGTNVGKTFTVTVVMDDVAEHPLAFITVTVKLPLLIMLIVCKIDPLLHK